MRPHAVDPDTRAALRLHYACARAPAWSDGARLAHAGPGFGHQIDLAALFTERALALTRPHGVLAFLLPAKLWRTLAGGGLRDLLLRESTPLALDDWSDAPAAFDAAVYPSLLVTRRRPATPTPAAPPHAAGDERAPAATVRVHRGRTTTAVDLPANALALDPAVPASPWLFLPPQVRHAFDALRAAGPALAHTALPRPTLGVKCGCNHAFLVEAAPVGTHLHGEAGDDTIACVRQGGRVGTVERALLRPALRGEHLARLPDAPPPAPEYLIWPYDGAGRLLDTLPPHAAAWLAPHRAQLDRRSDARGTSAWWTLFRTEAATAARPRVVWPDLARTPRPRVLPAGDPHVPLNTCYAAIFDTLDDARAFAALLAAPPVAAWLAALAEPARGGYRRFLAWTVALLPIPAAWPAARALLAPLGPSAPPHTLAAAAAAAYGLNLTTLAPLLAWTAIPSHVPSSSTPPAPPTTPPPRHVREPAWAAPDRTHARPRRTSATRS